MKIAEILKKMITFSNGNIHDIDHLIKVWTYAKTIGELEGLDPETQFVLEVAAITHDIACPLCREKYGNANGKYQEIEGAPLVTEFLSDTGMTTEQISRVAYLVGHHHTLTDIKGMDYQILIEADYIVNASENGYSKENVENFVEKIVKTQSGRELTRAVQGDGVFGTNSVPLGSFNIRKLCVSNSALCIVSTVFKIHAVPIRTGAVSQDSAHACLPVCFCCFL